MTLIELAPLGLFFIAQLSFMGRKRFVAQILFSAILLGALYGIQLATNGGIQGNAILTITAFLFLVISLSFNSLPLNRETIITIYSVILLSPSVKFAAVLIPLGLVLLLAGHMIANRVIPKKSDFKDGLNVAHLFFLTRGNSNFLKGGETETKRKVSLTKIFFLAFLILAIAKAVITL